MTAVMFMVLTVATRQYHMAITPAISLMVICIILMAIIVTILAL